ncbi:MAG: hypothetical protein U0807_14435 [Candidatus Binatia bacterium]
MLGLFKKAPKIEATFEATTAVARELAREVAVAGTLTLRNVGRDVVLTDLEVVLIAGGTRRIDLELPAVWRGGLRLATGQAASEPCAWTVTLAAPMRAPSAAIQVNTTAGGKLTPLAMTAKFPLGNE